MLYPTSGHAPTNAIDSYGQPYSAWELNDEASFTFQVPVGYTSGDDIVLSIKEATASASKAHKWQCEVIHENVTLDTVTSQVTSSASAYTVSTRSITLLSTGVSSGDAVTVILTRIAASSNEDSASIRLFNLDVTLTIDETLASVDCSGRIGDIIEKVLIATNDVNQEFVTATECLLWINECQRDIARNGYWEKVDTVDAVASQEDYNLSTLLTDFIALKALRWNASDTYGQIKPISSRGRYEEIKEDYTNLGSTTRPRYYYLHNSTVSIYPLPTANTTDGIKVIYNYMPTALGCSSNYTPETPEVFDEIYVNWCLRQCMQKDYTRGFAADSYRRAYAQYRELLANLLWQHRNTSSRAMKPYR
jgi:hypothetical protein